MQLEQVGLLRDVLDSAHNGVLIVDRGGRVLVWNLSAAHVTGRVSEEVVGRLLVDVEPETWEDMQEILATGQPQIGRSAPSLKGSTLIANRTPIVMDGEIQGVISVFNDASDYENVLAELKAYKDLNEELDVTFNSSYDG